MTQELVNKSEWLEQNPFIRFKHIKKAYFGKYLIKVGLSIPGGSSRFYGAPWQVDPAYCKTSKPFPTQQEFTDFMFEDCYDRAKRTNEWPGNWYVKNLEYVTQPQLRGNRYIGDVLWHMSLTRRNKHGNELVELDTHCLYELHKLRVFIPNDIRLGRSQLLTFIYCNSEERMKEIIAQLKLTAKDVGEIHYAKPDHINTLRADKEYSKWAKDWKYKVFFKEMSVANPELYSYLSSLEREGLCHIPYGTASKILRERPPGLAKATLAGRFWMAPYGRSHIYLNDLDTVLFLQMLAPGKYSNYIELVQIDDK